MLYVLYALQCLDEMQDQTYISKNNMFCIL